MADREPVPPEVYEGIDFDAFNRRVAEYREEERRRVAGAGALRRGWRCRLFGHRWRTVPGGFKAPHWMIGNPPEFVCTRCRVSTLDDLRRAARILYATVAKPPRRAPSEPVNKTGTDRV